MAKSKTGIPVGISIDGLNPEDRKRIAKIGLWAWMDEITKEQIARGVGRNIPASQVEARRHSLEYKQRQMARRTKRK